MNAARNSITGIVLAVLTVSVAAVAENGAPAGEWRHYGADQASSRYSPVDQINRDNVTKLVEVWRWSAPDNDIYAKEAKYRPGVFKPTPLMVGGRLILPTSLGVVAAVDPATGKTLWTYDPETYKEGRPANAGWQHRGVEYWTDGKIERILYARHDRKLVSLDPATGKPDPKFGVDGEGYTDLATRLGREINTRQYTHNSPPIVCGDTVVVGSIISDGPTAPEMPPGHVRGYDVRTGEMKWIFHTIPQEGELGVETWQDGSWKYTGNTNVWTTMSCDEELGYVYLPTSTPTNDWYGGHRKGDNLFAESIVALDARTGERKWHFQAVHHGLWDYDFPCAPNLADVTVDGKPRKILAQVSKQGFTYVLDRVTGEPIWPIEERPVPQTTVPGEWSSPTQPHPTKPPAFERQGVTEDDLIDFTPELRQMALDTVKDYVLGPIFTPPVLTGQDGKKGTLMLPSAAGGANWRGAALDPETGWLYVPSMTLLMVDAVTKGDPARVKFDYVYNGAAGGFLSGRDDLPVVKPPWGRITAIDLNKGEIAWQVPHGVGPKDHPLLKGLDLPERLGSAANGVLSNGGPLLTKTLLFAIQADESPKDMMRMGDQGQIAAWDKKTGELLWEHDLAPTPHGNPMTYLHQGRQYVVVAGGGGLAGTILPSELVAFALPK